VVKEAHPLIWPASFVSPPASFACMPYLYLLQKFGFVEVICKFSCIRYLWVAVMLKAWLLQVNKVWYQNA